MAVVPSSIKKELRIDDIVESIREFPEEVTAIIWKPFLALITDRDNSSVVFITCKPLKVVTPAASFVNYYFLRNHRQELVTVQQFIEQLHLERTTLIVERNCALRTLAGLADHLLNLSLEKFQELDIAFFSDSFTLLLFHGNLRLVHPLSEAIASLVLARLRGLPIINLYSSNIPPSVLFRDSKYFPVLQSWTINPEHSLLISIPRYINTLLWDPFYRSGEILNVEGPLERHISTLEIPATNSVQLRQLMRKFPNVHKYYLEIDGTIKASLYYQIFRIIDETPGKIFQMNVYNTHDLSTYALSFLDSINHPNCYFLF